MTSIIQIAIPNPLRQLFNYLSELPQSHWQTGMRVKVNFSGRVCIGIVISSQQVNSTTNLNKLKYIEQVLDTTSLLPNELIESLIWTSQYYHHSLGECFQTALPKGLNQGKLAELQYEPWWEKTDTKPEKILGNKQQACLNVLENIQGEVNQTTIKEYLGSSPTASLASLEKKGLIKQSLKPKFPLARLPIKKGFDLTEQQQKAVDSVWNSSHQFQPFLLHGITGSGKTEVYIELTKRVIEQNKQVLILIPEIGLTHQFVDRFRQQLNTDIVVWNSSISDGVRQQSWLLAQQNLAKVIIGTRSAVFMPLINPGIIIIDEEHDNSYKQQDGLRYHARQLALVRAKKLSIPLLMASATPSIDSLYQVQQQRYQLLTLNQRAGGASLPKVTLISSQLAHPDHGLTAELIKKIQSHLKSGNQVILFINRRGYAPVLMCHDCDWQAKCRDCDAKMVVHKQKNQLFCHHCGLIHNLPRQCPECQSEQLKSYGAGTEKVEENLQTLFSNYPVRRVDRDSTQKVNAFSELISEIHKGEPCILVGTQMLAKGHDFHNVTLVGILDTDQALYSADFRAIENLAQMVTQVTGRAGRGNKSGEVIIQTEQSEHPFWQQLLSNGYYDTAISLLNERQKMGMPPTQYWILIRAEAFNLQLANEFLTEVSQLLTRSGSPVLVLGPVPAVMEKRAGRYRAQLLLMHSERRDLHQLLDENIATISRYKLARQVRWSIDVDPVDLY